MRRFIFAVLAAALIFCGCADAAPAESPSAAPSTRPSPLPSFRTESPAEAAAREREEAVKNAERTLAVHFEDDFNIHGFVMWLEWQFPELLSYSESFSDRAAFSALLFEHMGGTLPVILDDFDGKLKNAETAREHGIYFAPEREGESIVLAFGGDVNLTDNGYVMPMYRYFGDIGRVITGGLLTEMRSADVLLLNNEFAFTNSTTPLAGKTYTFASKPENVAVLSEMGVDIAYLANNHVYDFGEVGLYDTLRTLDSAGIARIGAGMNLEEAKRPVYYIVGGRKIAFVGAGCIERYTVFTPGAADERSGIFRTDEASPEVFLEVIREAAASSDYVVANLHWGIESTIELEEYQRTLGQMCIDAGADAVLGSHPHVLQGAEFYEGKPIVYSMGNFWFSQTQNSTCLIQIILDKSTSPSIRFLPCSTGAGLTSLLSGEAAREVIDYYQSISFGVKIDENGYMSPA